MTWFLYANKFYRDEEYDQGKRKKIRQFKHSFGGPNPFQEIATKKSQLKKLKLERSGSANEPFRIWRKQDVPTGCKFSLERLLAGTSSNFDVAFFMGSKLSIVKCCCFPLGKREDRSLDILCEFDSLFLSKYYYMRMRQIIV